MNILLADDASTMLEPLRHLLEEQGHVVATVETAEAALAALRKGSFHLLITDLKMGGAADGLELLQAVRAERLPMGVVLLTAYGDTKIAVEAMKAGADDFVTKPYEPDRIRNIVARILERRRLIDELEQLRRQLREDYSFLDMVSKNARMKRVFDLIEQVGPHDSTVLIQGETGTGKELVARALHVAGRRQNGPWIALNCAARQETLLESELFGHERGSFTGAERLRQGWFELADGGTLFLDEIGEISPSMQAKLLRVLQTGTFERVGGVEPIRVDVRVVAASNRDLEADVKEGRFRSDLFYRLNVIKIELPPLRERLEDVPLLSMHFLERLHAKSNPPVTEIDHEAMQALLEHDWPGNVRELENAIKAAVAMADGSVIHRHSLPATVAPRRGRIGREGPLIDVERPLPELTEDLVSRVERDYLTQLLSRYRGNVARCARHSGLSRRSVAQKLLKHSLDRSTYKSSLDADAEADLLHNGSADDDWIE